LVYDVIWHEKAVKDLKNLDHPVRKRIVEKVKNHLCNNPEMKGKGLKGIFKGMFSFRVGDYRILYVMDREARQIKILTISHRKDIHKPK
jgi:mRNA interferase RelE/StbE